MTKEVIHVGLYGGKSIFGGKESPLEASVVSCDKHESCSFFKNGQCLAVRALFSTGCKFGSVNNVRGYTSKAKKYSSFKREWEQHQKYDKLKHPPTKLGLIDGFVVFPYSYVRIKEDEYGLRVTDPSFGVSISYIDYDKFTVELIKKICNYRPQALMGGEIKDYQKKTVPLFLAHLEEVLPERYREFIDTYPEYSMKIDHVGRKALLKTVNPSYVHYKSSSYPQFNEEWYWDGELLTYKNGYVNNFKVTKDYEITEIKIKPSDTSEIIISSNDQVTEDTVFID